MNKLDVVKLINVTPYKKNNLQLDARGIIVDLCFNSVKVLFFNAQNLGDYAIVSVDKKDLIKEKEDLPNQIKQELLSKLDVLLSRNKDYIESVKINNYDLVELIVEDEKYAKFGIHKGATGCVMDNNAVKNYIEVDFSGINEKGDFYGDCISVNIDHLRVIK